MATSLTEHSLNMYINAISDWKTLKANYLLYGDMNSDLMQKHIIIKFFPTHFFMSK